MSKPTTATRSWFRRIFEVIQLIDAAVDYRFEDHLEERIKRVEARIDVLEKDTRR